MPHILNLLYNKGLPEANGLHTIKRHNVNNTTAA